MAGIISIEEYEEVRASLIRFLGWIRENQETIKRISEETVEIIDDDPAVHMCAEKILRTGALLNEPIESIEKVIMKIERDIQNMQVLTPPSAD